MIEVKELRVGNLFSSESMELVVTGIEPGLIKSEINNKPVNLFDINCYPIPITPEWLERLGFKRTEYNSFNKGFIVNGLQSGIELNEIVGRGTSDHENTGVYHVEGLKIQIKHIHQLQNLYFALTGSELTASKEKI